MTQDERRLYLIKYLLNEQPQYAQMQIPKDRYGQKRLLRALFNVRMPVVASNELYMYRMNICRKN